MGVRRGFHCPLGICLLAHRPAPLRTVAGEQIITMTMCRNLEPSSAVRRHCSICSAVNVGGRSMRFPAGLGPLLPELDAARGVSLDPFSHYGAG